MKHIANTLTRLATHPVNYWGGVLVDAALASWFLVHALRAMHGTWVTAEAILFVGLGLYGFLEYVIHRWAYHDQWSPAAAGHQLHHADPDALIALPFFVPATIVVALWGLLRPLLGDGPTSILIVAIVISFLHYEFVHHALHHWRWTTGYLRRLRSHHRIHHEFPDRNFGVTMTVWDWVFGTHYLGRSRSRRRTVVPRPSGPKSR